MTQNINYLHQMLWHNTIAEWLTAIAVFVVCLVLLELTKTIVVKRLHSLAQRTENDIDDLIVDMLRKTHFLLLAVAALNMASTMLTLSATMDVVKGKLLILVFLFQVIVWGSIVIDYLIKRSVKNKKSEDPASATTIAALGFMGRIVLWSVVGLLALDNMGVNITTLVAGLGVGGIAIALAVQSVLGDLLASLSIVLDKPFVLGDFIIVEDYLGTVEYIGLKTTRIRSLTGEQIIFSNADLLRSRIRNNKRMQERRIVFTFGVMYETPHDQLAAIGAMVRGIIEAREGTRFDRAHFKEFGKSALMFEAAYYILDPDYNLYMDIQQKINLDLHKKFQEEGINFAYPTQTIHIFRTSDVNGEISGVDERHV